MADDHGLKQSTTDHPEDTSIPAECDESTLRQTTAGVLTVESEIDAAGNYTIVRTFTATDD